MRDRERGKQKNVPDSRQRLKGGKSSFVIPGLDLGEPLVTL